VKIFCVGEVYYYMPLAPYVSMDVCYIDMCSYKSKLLLINVEHNSYVIPKPDQYQISISWQMKL